MKNLLFSVFVFLFIGTAIVGCHKDVAIKSSAASVEPITNHIVNHDTPVYQNFIDTSLHSICYGNHSYSADLNGDGISDIIIRNYFDTSFIQQCSLGNLEYFTTNITIDSVFAYRNITYQSFMHYNYGDTIMTYSCALPVWLEGSNIFIQLDYWGYPHYEQLNTSKVICGFEAKDLVGSRFGWFEVHIDSSIPARLYLDAVYLSGRYGHKVRAGILQ